MKSPSTKTLSKMRPNAAVSATTPKPNNTRRSSATRASVLTGDQITVNASKMVPLIFWILRDQCKIILHRQALPDRGQKTGAV